MPGIIQAMNRIMGASKHVNSGDKVLTTGAGGSEGNWVELFPSMTIFGNWMNIVYHDVTVDDDFRVDIGIGASGQEVVYIPNLTFHNDPLGNNVSTGNMTLKVDIPKYARVVARAQNGNTENITVNVIISGVEFD